MAVDAVETWRTCFQQWPAEIERRGVLVTSFGEQILFDNFAISENMLLIERKAPDTVGARLVLVALGTIQAVKIIDVVKIKVFQSMGFVVTPHK